MATKQTVILVVEDEDAVRTVLTEALGDRENRRVTAVSDGAKALAFLDSVHPHLITLDITMPGLDGIAVYKNIRERAELNDVPVLFLSAQSRERTTSLGGWFKWMNKPFDINKLDATVTTLLAKIEH